VTEIAIIGLSSPASKSSSSSTGYQLSSKSQILSALTSAAIWKRWNHLSGVLHPVCAVGTDLCCVIGDHGVWAAVLSFYSLTPIVPYMQCSRAILPYFMKNLSNLLRHIFL
jgi:hypothetical protein